jgi:hypothetical protein
MIVTTQEISILMTQKRIKYRKIRIGRYLIGLLTYSVILLKWTCTKIIKKMKIIIIKTPSNKNRKPTKRSNT